MYWKLRRIFISSKSCVLKMTCNYFNQKKYVMGAIYRAFFQRLYNMPCYGNTTKANYRDPFRWRFTDSCIMCMLLFFLKNQLVLHRDIFFFLSFFFFLSVFVQCNRCRHLPKHNYKEINKHLYFKLHIYKKSQACNIFLKLALSHIPSWTWQQFWWKYLVIVKSKTHKRTYWEYIPEPL